MHKPDANLDLQSFIANVFAPIPAGEEAAATPKFRRLIARDINRAWEEGNRRLRKAHLLLNAERAKRTHPDAEENLLAQLHAEKLRQCMLLAPTKKHLEWKKRNTAWLSRLPEAVEQAIARDEKRFAVGAV